MSTEVRIRRDDVERLPAVCVVTGQQADGRMAASFPEREIGFLWFLLILGPIGLAAIALFLAFRKEVRLELPYTEKSFNALRQREMLRTKSAVFGVVTLLVGIFVVSKSPRIGLIFLALAALGWCLFAFAAWSIGTLQPSVEKQYDSLVLKGVHPNFVAAVEKSGRAVR